MQKRYLVTSVAVALGVIMAFWLFRPRPEVLVALPGERVGTLPPYVKESSGLVASRRNPGVLWTHGDSGNRATLFAVKSDGTLLGRFAVEAPNHDWESISIDDDGFLYVADTGNNSGKRAVVQILQVREPVVDMTPAEPTRAKLPVQRTIRLTYPIEPFDAEALIMQGGKGYLISKMQDAGIATLYGFDANEGEEASLRRVLDLPVTSPVTGGDISPDGNQLVVLANDGLHIFEIAGDLSALARVTPRRVVFAPPHGAEGCGFYEGGILVTTESRGVYFYPGVVPSRE